MLIMLAVVESGNHGYIGMQVFRAVAVYREVLAARCCLG